MSEIETVGTKEVAALLGITQTRVATLCRDGRFAGAKRVGNTWIIPMASVRCYAPSPSGRPKGR